MPARGTRVGNGGTASAETARRAYEGAKVRHTKLSNPSPIVNVNAGSVLETLHHSRFGQRGWGLAKVLILILGASPGHCFLCASSKGKTIYKTVGYTSQINPHELLQSTSVWTSSGHRWLPFFPAGHALIFSQLKLSTSTAHRFSSILTNCTFALRTVIKRHRKCASVIKLAGCRTRTLIPGS